MSYSSVTGHRSMALDSTRNQAYGDAMRDVIRPSSVVVDLGAGTGIHGLMAARMGAKRVYLVERENVVSVAEEIARANGLDNVVCIQGSIEDITLPERADVMLSVLTGNFLFAEDLLPGLFHARDTMLKPGGTMIPSAATMEAVPVFAPKIHNKEIASWSAREQGIDLGLARTYAANTVFFRAEEVRDAVYLAEPQELHSVDFSSADYKDLHVERTCEVASSGVCHGWLGWLNIKLGHRWLSTSPHDASVHWSPAFLPLDPPVDLERGERVTLTLDRVPFGDWTWRVRSSKANQQHSTMLSLPLNAAALAKANVGYRPALNDHGRALADVLARCDGTVPAGTIAQELCGRYPDKYPDYADALRFVQQVINTCSS